MSILIPQNPQACSSYTGHQIPIMNDNSKLLPVTMFMIYSIQGAQFLYISTSE